MLYVRTNTGLDQTGNRLSFEAQARDGAPPSEDDKRKHTVECGPKRALRILRILQSFSFRPLLSCRACHVTPRPVLLPFRAGAGTGPCDRRRRLPLRSHFGSRCGGAGPPRALGRLAAGLEVAIRARPRSRSCKCCRRPRCRRSCGCSRSEVRSHKKSKGRLDPPGRDAFARDHG